MSNSRAVKLPSDTIPDVQTVITYYEQNGGTITRDSHFGQDPLAGNIHLTTERIQQQFPDLSPVFHTNCNNDCNMYKSCLKLYIRLTEELYVSNTNSNAVIQ